MSGQDSAGRPVQPLPLVLQLLLVLVGGVAVLEVPLHLPTYDAVLKPWYLLAAPAYARYLPVRAWCITHPAVATGLGLTVLVVLTLALRAWLLFWHNQVKARLTGTHFTPEVSSFPMKVVDLIESVKLRPKDTTFVGLEARRGAFGWAWRPFFVSAKQRSMHTHVLGKTGSGKTASVIWPSVLQDALDGKGILVMDAKGSDENVRTMKAIAALAGRSSELRVFALPAWNQPHVFSHTYNMVYVRPRTPTDAGGDPVAVAERVFSVMPLGDNEYYNTQAQVMFTLLCRVLHGMVDGAGNGFVFTLRDVAVCLKGWGDTGAYSQALNHCLSSTVDKEAAREAQNQVIRLGRDAQKAFSGIVGAVDKFLSPLVNAYAPDIVFEDVLQKNGLVYVQLPGNLFKIQAPAMGKVMLMDVQQEGSLRQVFRSTRNQTPFSVTVDEFYNFADITIVDSLNKLRDANLHFTLAHQSIADLELVSKEFATAVWDNTRTKFILNQDNPELCEKVSKSIGTHQIVEKTVRQQQGALFTSLTTGDASTKLVETFRLHPNAVKSLASCGQGYCYFGSDIVPLAFGMLPPLQADYPLTRAEQSTARGLRLEAMFLQGAAPASVGPVDVADALATPNS
jgi:type IV secretory pathway TraG/TraD family ATPase VirD4